MKWGMQAFDTFGVVPPGFGIVHQVNLEYLARGVLQDRPSDAKTKGATPVYYPDSLVGTDSHTTMINGIGVVGWGVGGIEAEAGHAGPAGLLPDARRGRVRVHRAAARRRDRDRPGARPSPRSCGARKSSASSSSSSATAPPASPCPTAQPSANMAPEYGATMGFFPVDDKTIEYFKGTGRTAERDRVPSQSYFKAQKHVRHGHVLGEVDYSQGRVASTSAPCRPASPVRSVRRTGSSSATVKTQFDLSLLANRRPRTASTSRPSGLLTRHLVRAR